MLKSNIISIIICNIFLIGCASTSCTGQGDDQDKAYMKAIYNCAQVAEQNGAHSFGVQTLKQSRISSWNNTDGRVERLYTYNMTINGSPYEIASYCNTDFVLKYLPDFINGTMTFMSSPIASSIQLVDLYDICMGPELTVI